MNRRRFLSTIEQASCGLAVGTVALSLGGCAGNAYLRGTVVDNSLRIPLDRLVVGGGQLLVTAPDQRWPLFVVRHDDGRLTTVSTRCMHRGCQVDPVAERLVCPCHGSEYTREGAVLKGPTRAPLHRFATRVVGDEVLIDLQPLGEGS